MQRKSIIVLFFLAFWVVEGLGAALAEGVGEIEPILKNDRILILAPHPDDETIGCAGLIQRALKTGAEVKVVYLTSGDHNEFAFIVYEKRLTFRRGEFIHMGLVRRLEAIKAMNLLGLSEDKLVFLGYPDFGTFTIFSKYWQTQKPFRSFLTRISKVPYKSFPSYGAPYVGESILNDLEKFLLNYRPTKIFVSHPADVNSDHKALHLFLQVALRDLRNQIPQAKVYSYLIHWSNWPRPRHYHPNRDLEPPRNFLNSQINWLKLDLSPEESARKHQAVLCYRSQTQSSASYLLSFARKNELFGDYPGIVLSRQASLKERSPAFFGFSNMFVDSDKEGIFDYSNFMEDQQEISYAIVDNCILIRLENTKELRHNLNLMLYIFGYSDKVPFASMPKIRIITKHDKFRMYDGRKMISSDGVRLDFGLHELLMRIPLNILGDPDFILTSIKAYRAKLSVEATGFRKILIK